MGHGPQGHAEILCQDQLCAPGHPGPTSSPGFSEKEGNLYQVSYKNLLALGILRPLLWFQTWYPSSGYSTEAMHMDQRLGAGHLSKPTPCLPSCPPFAVTSSPAGLCTACRKPVPSLGTQEHLWSGGKAQGGRQ